MESNQEKNPTEQISAMSDKIQKGKHAFKLFGRILIVIALVAVCIIFLLRNHVSTDNAQIEADIVPVAARVGGQIAEVMVQENQAVKKGDVLVKIDDADYLAKLNQAQADLQVAQAQLDNAKSQEKVLIASARGGYHSAVAMLDNSNATESTAEAQVASAQAHQRNAELEYNRTKSLFESGGTSRSELDNAQTTYDMANAALQQAQAGLEAARSLIASAKGKVQQSSPVEEQIAAARAQTALADAKEKSAEASLALAQNQLDYTTIKAANDGMISKLSVHPGQMLSAGQTVGELVPTVTYVIANFKETQIAKIAPGDKVKVHVDAYPGKPLEGEVESISGGTGARFSLLPADNASGNFVKVVQRIPVRVRWTHAEAAKELQAGLSVKVTVYSVKKA